MPRFRANLYLPPFPARTFHAQLPLCPNMESPSSTPPPPENYIIGHHATGSPALRFPGGGSVELVDSIHAQNAPPHRAEMRDDSSKSKGKPPNCTTFVDQVVPWLLTTLLSSGNTPGIDYGALSKIQNLWSRRRTLPEGV